MTLGLQIVDYARSNRPLAQRLARHIPKNECISAAGQPLSMIAALEFYGRYRVDARHDAVTTTCNYLIRTQAVGSTQPPPEGWRLVARERRPTDRNNLTSVYQRTAP